jgi:hypothetical protein
MSTAEPRAAIAAARDLAGQLELLARAGFDPDAALAAHVNVLARYRDLARSLSSALSAEARLAGDALGLPPGNARAAEVRNSLSRAGLRAGAAGDALHAGWLALRRCAREFSADTGPDWCLALDLAKNAAWSADDLDDAIGAGRGRDADPARLAAGHQAVTAAMEEGAGHFRRACQQLHAAASTTSGIPVPDARRTVEKAVDPVFRAAGHLRDAQKRIRDARQALEGLAGRAAATAAAGGGAR